MCIHVYCTYYIYCIQYVLHYSLDIRVVFFGNVEVLVDALLDCSCDNNGVS